jgi:arabinose-5-phosphate isomerase
VLAFKIFLGKHPWQRFTVNRARCYNFNLMDRILSATPNALVLARDVLNIEAAAVQALSMRLDESFISAMNVVLQCEGRVIVSGMGKSGHIARKIAATLSSTGTPAYFVHPAEASHGDLGMITSQDVIIALSYSGESQELMTIVPVIKRQGAKLISMTGNPSSSLAKVSDVHLNAAVDKEACPMGLAPTASTTAALALGDALAVALLDAKGFGAEDFARSHPGGSLGRRLLTRVSDIMRVGERLPMVNLDATLGDAILEISKKGVGMTAIVDAKQHVMGIYTDGDLRRTLAKKLDLNTTPIQSVMSANPRRIGPDSLAAEAVQMMEQFNINQMLVVDEQNRLVGALNMHDLLHAKVI